MLEACASLLLPTILAKAFQKTDSKRCAGLTAFILTCQYDFVNACVLVTLHFRYQRSAALGDTLAQKKINDFGLVDVPALIKSRVMRGVKNFAQRHDKTF